ncbi:MAG: hypothetical protein ACREU4_04990 [Burkholderiales bacterium]
MFAAIRLPAARRFAGTILRATTTGSINFIAILAGWFKRYFGKT